MIGATNGTNRLTFGGDPVPDTDSGSLIQFPHHCRLGHFKRFISISHTVTGRFSRQSARWLRLTFWERSGGHQEQDQSGKPDSNPWSLLVEATKVQGIKWAWRWRSYALGCSQVCLFIATVRLLVVLYAAWFGKHKFVRVAEKFGPDFHENWIIPGTFIAYIFRTLKQICSQKK